MRDNPFIYEDLPEHSGGKISIRVLAVFPGAAGDPIQCQLRTVVLDNVGNAPAYEALSYCWGDHHETELISCNGQDFYVRPNLETALRHLRCTDRTRVLWADAICINQNNIPERNYQVSIMSLVYRQAERVVVFLGEASDTTEEALRLLNKLSDASEIFDNALSARQGMQSVWNWPELKDFLGLEVDARAYYQSGPVLALNQLMQRPWFGRLWIVQEVTSAKEILILCGKFDIPWRKFYDGVKFAKEVDIAIPNYKRPAYICWSPFILRLEQKREVDILYLLQEYHYAGCADARDKIFGHFGLTHLTHLDSLRSLRNEFASIGITPDYSMKDSDVYRKLAYGIMTTKSNLDILSVLGLFPIETPSLPSWVPDWKPSNPVAPLLTYTKSGSEPKLYHASLGSKASPRLINEETLVLSGFIYDTILHISNNYKWLGDYSPDSNHSTTDTATHQSVWQYVRPQLKWLHSNVTLWAQWDYLALTKARGNRREAVDTYWQTLICACKADLSAYPEIFGRDMNDTRCKAMFDKWFRCRFFTRLAYRLGLASSPHFLFAICIALDVLLMLILTRGQPALAYRFFWNAKVAGRRVARTRKGHLALVTPEARVGDAIGVFRGGKMPLVVRSTGKGTWRVLGDGYVHGIMKGEIWDEGRCEEILIE
jgi:hypothetical protein